MATKTKTTLQGSFVVLNPRSIPKGRFIIRDGNVRYFEGDTYNGDKADHWLERGFIRAGLPKIKAVKGNG